MADLLNPSLRPRGVSKKRWAKFVKKTHERGFTVAGALSGAPDALKERTRSSLRREAERTVAAAYKPVQEDLSRRALSAQYLAEKRAQDDVAFRNWISGETGKLDAQSKAADATLRQQQSDIADGMNAAQTAAAADSLKKVAAQAGNVSDPTQSTALDYSAADKRSDEMVANERTHSADLAKIGADADTMSKAALYASVAARESTRRTELWKTQADIEGDRKKTVAQMAADAAEQFTKLKLNEGTKAQANREFGLASAQLGVKQQSIEADIAEANRKYKLDTKKFNLDKWTARHKDKADRLKRQIDYDRIAAQDGRAAADRALKKSIADDDRRERRLEHRDKAAGIGKDERSAYRDTETARGMIARWHRLGKDPLKLRAYLRNKGVSDPMIDVANDLYVNKGTLSQAGRAKAKRIGVAHPSYFWTVAAAYGGPGGPHGTNRP